jgi:hypothetical protein
MHTSHFLIPSNHKYDLKQEEVMAVKRFLLLALIFSVVVTTGPVLADGEFYVVAGGGGVGTKITSLPYTINDPGFYYVTGNLTAASGNGIIVTKDDVTIDLMGFRINGTTGGTGILLNGRKNVEVRNGTFQGWGTVIAESQTGSGHRVLNVRADTNSIGIFLYGMGHLVKGCTALSNASYGIFVEGGTISGNVASQCGTGIYCKWGSVIGNSVWCNANQKGIEVTTDSQYAAVVDQNAVSGPGTRFSGGSSATVWGMNGGNPPHMNYPAPY